MEIVKLREKIAYGFGDAASSIFWKLFTMYLLFFYTDVVGLNALAVGTMIFITRLVGFISRSGNRHHGRQDKNKVGKISSLFTLDGTSFWHSRCAHIHHTVTQ